MCTTDIVGTWEVQPCSPGGSRRGCQPRGDRRLWSIHDWVADRGVVLSMTAKATSRSEGRPRYARISVGERSRIPVHGAVAPCRCGCTEAGLSATKAAAPGIDGMTVATYAQGLEDRLEALCDRIHSGRSPAAGATHVHSEGRWWTTTSRHTGAGGQNHPKCGGREVLSAIYEVDFLDCSYGFRPKRNAH